MISFELLGQSKNLLHLLKTELKLSWAFVIFFYYLWRKAHIKLL